MSEYQVAETFILLKACTESWKAISELNGLLLAIGEDFSSEEIKLLHIFEAKHALETEGENIANIRVIEAYASENKLNEPTAALIFDMANIAQNLKQTNASALSLNFPFIQKSKKSGFHLPLLKREINQYLLMPPQIDELLYLGLLHGYIVMQKMELKYQLFLANTLINHWLKDNQMLQLPVLPLSLVFKSDFRQADELIKEAYESGGIQQWLLYFLSNTTNAAKMRMVQMKNLAQLKRSTREILHKYTFYPLPAEDLLNLLFEKPFLKAADIISRLKCHRQTAYTYLDHLEKLGLVIQKKSGREKLYFHKRLFDILIGS